MLTTELKLRLSEHELLEENLDTVEKMRDYLETNGSFEPIKGIGPIMNQEILNKLAELDEVPTEPAEAAPEPPVEAPVPTPPLPAKVPVEALVGDPEVCVCLNHIRGSKSHTKMKKSEVAGFWSMNKKNWVSYDVV